MSSRNNALSAITKFWLEYRHGYLVRESIPVPVKCALSDIDLLAMHPKGAKLHLPGGGQIGSRIIVETKDEHDWEPTGKEFAKLLQQDVAQLSPEGYVSAEVRGIKFSMLREQHFRCAEKIFGTSDFDRLFVVHAIDPAFFTPMKFRLADARIFWISICDIAHDLLVWYDQHSRRAELRQDLTADFFHLLVGFCGFRPESVSDETL